jgi:dTDP-4-dehydrorhamnose 3,5-epimerase
LNVTETSLPGVKLIEPRLFHDDRGFFFETYHRERLRAAGITEEFVQDNQSRSKKNVVRGLHYQEPNGQGKLVRCVRGAIWDVGVDLRPGSDSYLEWHAVELTADNRRGYYLPQGIAHGFQTLTDDCEVQYLMGAVYVPEAGRGVRWDDPAFAIAWPAPHGERTISERDAGYPDFVA